jgi:hypothetical protein
MGWRRFLWEYGKAAALTCVLLVISFGTIGLAKLIMGKQVQFFKV